jgi:dolichyl-phosphate-mannose-protein mannosyltransferase
MLSRSVISFDEVHFGKFASYYLRREYFFDVHPPLGKLLLAFAGWFVGYDGQFLFDNIGDDYISNKVPYIAMRALPATFGSLIPPLVFLILKELGVSLPGAIFGAALLVLGMSSMLVVSKCN